jgi:hypothetical protein
MELTIVAQGLAYFRTLSPIGDFAQLPLILSLLAPGIDPVGPGHSTLNMRASASDSRTSMARASSAAALPSFAHVGPSAVTHATKNCWYRFTILRHVVPKEDCFRINCGTETRLFSCRRHCGTRASITRGFCSTSRTLRKRQLPASKLLNRCLSLARKISCC